MIRIGAAASNARIGWARRWSGRATHRRSATAEDAAPRGGIRALVPIAPIPADPEERRTRSRPAAAFLAQLIAARLGLPQTREKHRAGIREAEAGYLAAAPHPERADHGSLVKRDA